MKTSVYKFVNAHMKKCVSCLGSKMEILVTKGTWQSAFGVTFQLKC